MSTDDKPTEKLQRSSTATWLFGIAGAIFGSVAGWFFFSLIANEGYYALAIPGAAVGLGFASFARKPMVLGGVFCAIVALLVMLYCEWSHFPFEDCDNFLHSLALIHHNEPMTYVLLAVGTACAFWFGRGS